MFGALSFPMRSMRCGLLFPFWRGLSVCLSAGNDLSAA